jgi:glycosyltransferase involved in cell wall biosynthesis
MVAVHGALGTWTRQVDRYIALSQFARRKLIEGGLPADKLIVKPNALPSDPGPGEGAGGYALFVGRLSPEKGVATLLAAWEQVGERLPLRVVGDGPLAALVTEVAGRVPGVRWLGARPASEVQRQMAGAACLVFPSEWYEGFPMVILEALAAGTPVVAARIGAGSELVRKGETGLHFEPGNPPSLAAAVRQAVAAGAFARMRDAARREYEARYSTESNCRALVAIYDEAIAASRARTRRERLPAALRRADL